MSDERPLAGTGFVLEAASGREPHRLEVSRPSEGTLLLELAPETPGGRRVRLASIDLPTATVEPAARDARAALILVSGRGESTPLPAGVLPFALEPGDALLVARSGIALRWMPWNDTEAGAFRGWLRADATEAARVREDFVLYCEGAGIPGPDVHDLALALQETLDNVIEHGYRDQPRGVALVEAARDAGGRMRVVVRDRGTEFDPASARPPDTTATLGERRVGGLGIHLVRSLVDALDYERRDGENRLVLVKRFTGS